MNKLIAGAVLAVAACSSDAATATSQQGRPPGASVQEITDWTSINQPRAGGTLGNSDEMWVRVLVIDGRRCIVAVEHYDRGSGVGLDCREGG
jgi:hypothetical protein